MSHLDKDALYARYTAISERQYQRTGRRCFVWHVWVLGLKKSGVSHIERVLKSQAFSINDS